MPGVYALDTTRNVCEVGGMRVLVVMSLLGMGCFSQNQQDPSKPSSGNVFLADGRPDLREYVGKDAIVDQGTLRFVSPDEQKRFLAAQKCFATRGASWEHYPLRQIGNFVEEEWCRGEGSNRGCSGGGFHERAGVDWSDLSTLYYPPQWPNVFGLNISGGRNRASGDNGWSVAFSISSNGKSIISEGAAISFRRGTDELYVGSGYEWSIAERRFSQVVKEEPWALFERLRSSSDVLRDEGIKQWRALEKEVVTALESNDVRKCVYGAYKNDGIPPPCVDKVPLAPAEQATELAKIRTKVGRTVELLEKESGAMHTALLELASPDCF